MISRLLCSPGLQRFYTSIRRLPVVGKLVHGLVGKLLPFGTRVPVKIRCGAAAGLLLSVDPRYEVLFAAGDYETLLLEKLASHLQEGDVLYDVGAHIGFISLVAARLVGPEGKVYAFEADAENSERILEHLRLNFLPQIELVPAAVWSECTKLCFRTGSDSSSRGMGYVSGVAEHEKVPGVSVVRAVTLDRFAVDHRPPTVVKVDVEGAEVEVLAGAEDMFHASRPALICEIHSAPAAEGVSKWLTARNYTWSWLAEQNDFPRHLVARAQG